MSRVKECMDWQGKGMPLLWSCSDICSLARAKGGRSLSAPAAAERGKEGERMHQCHRGERERLLSASHHSSLHLHSRRWLLSGESLLRLKCQSPRWCEGAGCPAHAEEVPQSSFDGRLKLLQRHQTLDYIIQSHFLGFEGINNLTVILRNLQRCFVVCDPPD